jgi:hypothetical protein
MAGDGFCLRSADTFPAGAEFGAVVSLATAPKVSLATTAQARRSTANIRFFNLLGNALICE